MDSVGFRITDQQRSQVKDKKDDSESEFEADGHENVEEEEYSSEKDDSYDPDVEEPTNVLGFSSSDQDDEDDEYGRGFLPSFFENLRLLRNKETKEKENPREAEKNQPK